MVTYRKKNSNLTVTSDGYVDPKYKTVLVTYPDGKTRSLSSSTLSTYWEIVENSDKSNDDSIYSSIAILAETIASTMGAELKTYESSYNMLTISYNGYACMEIWVGRQSFKARVKSKVLKDMAIPWEKHSYNFDATVILPYDDGGYDTLEKLITQSIIYSSIKHKKPRKS